MTGRFSLVSVFLAVFLLVQMWFPLVLIQGQAGGTIAPPAPTQTKETVLSPDSAPIEREIKGGETHAYTVTLTAGSCLNLKIFQHEIDILAKVFGPEVTKPLEYNVFTTHHAPDFVTLVAPVRGTYRIEVVPFVPDAPPAKYDISILEIRPARPTDQDRMEAQLKAMEGTRLFLEGTKEGLLKAVPVYEAQREGFHRAGDTYAEAYSLDNFATLKRLLGQLKEAKAMYVQALELKRASHPPLGVAATLNLLGICCQSLSETKEALAYYEEALKICQEQRDELFAATIYSNLGMTQRALGNHRLALQYYQKVLDYKPAPGVYYSLVETYNNMAVIYDELGEVRLSLDYYLKALAEAGDNQISLSTLLSNVGYAYRRLGEYQKALDFYNRALEKAQAQGSPDGEATALFNFGRTYVDLGEPRRALAYYQQSLALYQKTGDRRMEANLLSYLGQAYKLLGQIDACVEMYDRCLVIKEEIGDRFSIPSIQNTKGVIQLDQGHYQRAVEIFKSALRLTDSPPNPAAKALILHNLGQAFRGLRQLEESHSHLEQALAMWQSFGDRGGIVRALADLARTEQLMGRLNEAKNHATQALELVEFLRNNVAAQTLRTSYFASVQSYYGLYVSILLDLHRQEPKAGFDRLAFQVSEQARARALLDLLGEARLDFRKGVAPELIRQEQDLKQRIANKYEGLARLLARKHSPEQRTAAEQEIATLTEQYRTVETEIRQKSPAYAALVQPKPLTVETIQTEILDSDTLLLEYLFGETRSQVFAISKTGFTVYELPPGEKINQQAQRVYDLLNRRTTASRRSNLKPDDSETAKLSYVEQVVQADREYPQAAAELSRMILGPLQKELGSRRLVIVADGRLHLIPFAALPPPDTVTAQEVSYLIEQHEILSLPSIAVLSALRQKREEPTQTAGVAVVADPVFEATDVRLKETKPSILPTSATVREINRYLEPFAEEEPANPLRDSEKLRAMHIPRLPGTRLEAEAIRNIAGEKTLVRLDFQASRRALLETDFSRFRYIHLATHGLMNFEHPDLSAVLLSLVDEKGNPVDGFLRLQDLYNLNWPAEVVTLSACQTGLGPNIKGEGLIGLTRGLMYAGARRVVVSSWNVNDRATAQLMTGFYQGMLRDGLRPVAALQAAQKQILAQRRWHAPYYWAAFQMQGDWR